MLKRSEELEKTIRFLQQSRDPLAGKMLETMLDSGASELISSLIQALIARNDESSLRCLAMHFEKFGPYNQRLVASRSARLRHIIPKMLKDPEEAVKRAAISVICHMGIAEDADKVIAIAEDSSHSEAIYARDQLLDWAHRCRENQERPNEAIRNRTLLQQRLFQSLRRYSKHQVPAMLDALVITMRWTDSAVVKFFRDEEDSVHETLLLHLRRTIRPDGMKFLADALNQKNIPAPIAQLLHERQDSAFVSQIGLLANQYFSLNMRKNLGELGTLEALHHVSPLDEAFPIAARRGIWLLLTHKGATRKTLLQSAIQFFSLEDETAGQAAVDMLDRIEPLKFEDETLAMAYPSPDADQAPPSNGTGERNSDLYLKLIELFPKQSKETQGAIAKIFQAFSYQELKKYLGRWNPGRLWAAAQVICAIESDWKDKVQYDLESPAPQRRAKALHSLLFLGSEDDRHWDMILSLLYDSDEDCRIRAVEVVGSSTRSESHEILERLANDSSPTTAFQASIQLERRAKELAEQQANPSILEATLTS